MLTTIKFKLGRYVSCNETIWGIFSFSIHERYPTVVHLAVHLENGQRVYFTEANAAQRAERPPATTLTNFFSTSQTDPFARTLFYSAMPHFYTWNAALKKAKSLLASLMSFLLMPFDAYILVYIRILEPEEKI